MAWTFRRRKPRGDSGGPTGLVSGIHRSPGFGALCEELGKRRVDAILDLGPTSTENLSFLSQLSENVTVQDLFRSCGGEEGARSSIYRFPDVATLPLPESGPYDAVLMWDLFHYLERAQIRELVARLTPLCAEGTLLLVMASAQAPIPVSPLGFRIAGRAELEYRTTGNAKAPAPELTPRVVEQLVPSFRPLRFFQLRNGLQEFLFRYEPEKPAG